MACIPARVGVVSRIKAAFPLIIILLMMFFGRIFASFSGRIGGWRQRQAGCPSGRGQPLAFGVNSLSESDLWLIRITSGLTSYFGFLTYSDRPRGKLLVDPEYLEIRQSSVPGAGLGLFVTTNLPKDTVLGTYPGVVIPLEQNLKKLQQYPQCEGYIWRFSDNKFVIDPTNRVGDIEDFCMGGNPSMILSEVWFETLLSFIKVPTALCRINEPPRGKDVNVITDEDRDSRSVTFSLERNVYAGEELFIDYGLSYDRSAYGGIGNDSDQS